MTEDKISASTTSADREAYLDHRRQLIELGIGQINLFDKSILFAASGALGLSVAFLDELSGRGEAVYSGMLLCAWLLLVFSLLLNIVSYKTSWWDTEIEIRKLDDSYSRAERPDFTGNFFRRVTISLNFISLMSLTLGVAMLLLFAFQNLERSDVT